MLLLSHFRILLLGVSRKNADISFRRFNYSKPYTKTYLTNIGLIFLEGYHSGLTSSNTYSLSIQLNDFSKQSKGFAFEGAAMAFTILDGLSLFKKDRLSKFLETEEGRKNIYTTYVGSGWAFARLPINVEKRIEKFDSVLRWLVIDGYGFHQAYFKTKEYVFNNKEPKELKKEFSKHVFYQGVGRCLWFVEGTDGKRIADRINTFLSKYHQDLWSGIGLACTYAGGVGEDDVLELKKLSKDYLPYLMQGSAFAAKARDMAEIIVPHTEMTCRIICDITLKEASKVCDVCLEKVPANLSSEEKYEMWRALIRSSIYKAPEHEKISKEVVH